MPLASWIELQSHVHSLDGRLSGASHATTSAFEVAQLEKESVDLLFECVKSREAANAPPQLTAVVESAESLRLRCKALAAKVIGRRPEEAMAAGLIAPPVAHIMPTEINAGSGAVPITVASGMDGLNHDLSGDIAAVGGLERFVAAQIERAAAGTSQLRVIDSESCDGSDSALTTSACGDAEPRVAVARLLRARAERDALFGASGTRTDIRDEQRRESITDDSLEDLEGATDMLLQGAQDMTAAMQTSMGIADAVSTAVERNLEATNVRISRLKQHSSAVGWTFLGHIAAVMAAMAAFTIAYIVIRLLPRGSIY